MGGLKEKMKKMGGWGVGGILRNRSRKWEQAKYWETIGAEEENGREAKYWEDCWNRSRKWEQAIFWEEIKN